MLSPGLKGHHNTAQVGASDSERRPGLYHYGLSGLFYIISSERLYMLSPGLKGHHNTAQVGASDSERRPGSTENHAES